MDIIDGLNEPQKQAVETTEGPLLVMAGAGSGKTRVLTTKIAHLIRNKGVKPYEILAITFTNKAAKEMKDRVAGMVPEDVNDIWVCTFHAACMRILRKQAIFAGYKQGFLIYDDSDQQTVVKECLKELNIDDKKFTPRSIMSSISQAKNRLVGPKEFEEQAYDFFSKLVTRVYTLYQSKLIHNNALDFDDILMVAVNLFKEHPHILKYYQNKFRYILVDEYQDTNHAQYALVKMLAEEHRNICVVGDPDQGIYSWRGADISNILDFEKDYKEAKLIVLDRNYRSTPVILDAANQLIKNNPDRKEKKLWTAGDKGTPIILFVGETERMEADYVADRIQKLYSQKSIPYKNMAVFYRTNAMSRVLEEAFMRRTIPYKIIGGLRFYERKEIKDLMSYLRLVGNPLDEVSLSRIINVPKRGIGEASIQKILLYSRENGLSCVEALLKAAEISGLTKKARNACELLGKVLQSYSQQVENMTVTKITEGLLEDTGYWAELEAEKTVESQTRQENLKEFLSVTSDFDRTVSEPTLSEFLAGVALVSDIDNYDEESDQVGLITIHSAKGLEFPVVFLIGMEEGVFPHSKAIEDPHELYEERRLAYVGITRAKELLYLTRCRERTLYGNTKFNSPSRFLKEIPKELTTIHDPIDGEMPVKSVNSVSAGLWGKQISNAVVQSFSEGDRVMHRKWGLGSVINVRGKGDTAEITVEFPGQGQKALLAKYAPLEKV